MGTGRLGQAYLSLLAPPRLILFRATNTLAIAMLVWPLSCPEMDHKRQTPTQESGRTDTTIGAVMKFDLSPGLLRSINNAPFCDTLARSCINP